MAAHPKASVVNRTTLRTRRALTKEERELAEWMIRNGDSDQKDLFLNQLHEAVVVRHCPCGCDSVDFHIPSKGESTIVGLTLIGDYLYGTEKSGLCGAFVFAKGHILAGLEVYSLDGLTTPKLPKISELKPIGGCSHPEVIRP